MSHIRGHQHLHAGKSIDDASFPACGVEQGHQRRELTRILGKTHRAIIPTREKKSIVVAIWVYFRFVVLRGMDNPWTLSILATLIAVVIAFLFSAVSAWAVAMISVTPISGMTLMTLIIAAVLLSMLGLKGDAGMIVTNSHRQARRSS